MKLENKIRWEFVDWIEWDQNQARVEGELEGKFYTAVAHWFGDIAWDVEDIEEIAESELYNKTYEIIVTLFVSVR